VKDVVLSPIRFLLGLFERLTKTPITCLGELTRSFCANHDFTKAIQHVAGEDIDTLRDVCLIDCRE